MEQHLFAMLGYPGSGKSTFARQLAPAIHAVRLNADSLRYGMFDDETQRRDPTNNTLVFSALDYAARERSINRVRTIDQPNIAPGRYEELISNLEPPAYDEDCIILDGSQPFDKQLAKFEEQMAAY